MNTQNGNIPAIKTINEKVYRIDKDGRYMSRYQVNITQGLDEYISLVNKPTERLVNLYTDKIQLTDGKMNLSGFMYLFYTDHNESQLPKYTLYLVKDNEVVSSHIMDTTTGLYDITNNINSGHIYTHVWFELDNLDLTILENGTYQLFISEECGEYYEFTPLLDEYNMVCQKLTYQNREFCVEIDTNNFNRISLVISDEVISE